jgi:hypothetical protein
VNVVWARRQALTHQKKPALPVFSLLRIVLALELRGLHGLPWLTSNKLSLCGLGNIAA